MTIRYGISLLALVLGGQGVRSQELHSIPGTFDTFTTDELGNVYAISGDVLTLYDTQGHEVARNSVKTMGRITQMDAFYSLKPMLFSAEQGQLAVLDNTLSVQTVLNLARSGFQQVSLACMSVQNAFWFFNDREMELVRVDAQLRPLANTGRLDQLLGFAVRPTGMQEHDNRLYVNVPSEGILVFDLFGTYDRTIPLKEVSSFEVRGGSIHHLVAGMHRTYDRRSFDIHNVDIQGTLTTLRDVRVERGRTYVLLDDRIAVLQR